MIRLTFHAEDMIADRGIEMSWITATIEQPDHRSVDPHDMSLTRSFRRIPSAGGRVLRVVHRPDGENILVITAFFDRGVKL